MDHLSSDSIARLVRSKSVRGRTLFVTFECPETGVREVASAPLRERPDGEAAAPPAPGLFERLRLALSSAVSVSPEPASAPDGEPVTAFTVEELEAATHEAFIAARPAFRWSASRARWIGGKAPTSAFQRRLLEAPVTCTIDQMIVVRTLLELAHADGVVSHEELMLIRDFTSSFGTTVEEALQCGPLGPVELSLASEGARPSIVMIAWACAMCDEHLDDREEARIREIAEGLGLDAALVDELRADARQFLMQQALAEVYVDGVRRDSAFDEVTFVAESIGVPLEEVEAMDLRMRDELEVA